MRAFDVKHDDPVPVARTAAILSRTEQDPATRADSRAMTPEQRVSVALDLSLTLSQIKRAE